MFSLSDTTVEKFNQLMEKKNVRTNSDLIEELVDKEFESINQEQELKEILVLLKKLSAAINSVELMAYENRDMINSLCHFYDVQKSEPAEINPHRIINQSKKLYNDKIHAQALQASTDNLMKK